MCLLKLIFCIAIGLMGLSSAQNKKEPPFVISVTHWQRTSGIWGSWMMAQDNSQIPPMYFVCGISFRQMIWKKNMSSGCPSTCSFSTHTFKSMYNAVKITYCRYNDWNKQIQKIFETTESTENNGVYKQYKCPRYTYATKATSKFGFQYETDLGLNGIQFVCEDINLNENPTTVQDPSKGWTAPLQSPPKFGFFMSAVIFKYEVNGKFTGINFGYSGVPVISKLVFQYGDTSDTYFNKVYETSYAQNQGTLPMQVMKDVNKSFLADNLFRNQILSTHEYDIDKNSIIEQYEFVDEMLIPDTKRQLTVSNFSFNSMIQSKKQISQHLCLQVGSCKKVQIITQVNLNKAKTVYTVVFTFNNRLTGELIGISGKIKGVWTGTLISSVKSKSIQSNADQCVQSTSNNLTTE